jgi:hypothetical protein
MPSEPQPEIVGSPRVSSPLVNMAAALNTFMSYLKLPLLASSGIAAVLSGLLYFKQK